MRALDLGDRRRESGGSRKVEVVVVVGVVLDVVDKAHCSYPGLIFLLNTAGCLVLLLISLCYGSITEPKC